MNDKSSEKSNSPFLGLLLMCIAVFSIVFSGQIEESGLGQNSDPGPRAFPIGISVFLIVCSIYEFSICLLWSKGSDGSFFERLNTFYRAVFSSDGKVSNVISLIVSLAIYIPAISWLGFSSSTLIFASVLMKCLGARWWVAISMALCATLVIQFLFVGLFKVQLPSGALGLPF